MTNAKLSTKLTGGFILVAVIIAIVGAVGFYAIRVMGGAFDTAMEKQYPLADASMESMIALISGRDLLGDFLLTEDNETFKKAEDGFNQSVLKFDQNAEYILKNGNEALKDLVQTADEYHNIFRENSIELMKHQRLHLKAEQAADLLMADFDRHSQDLGKLLGAYEAQLTRDVSIDQKVDASMEAKTVMVRQKALAEEYMGVESLPETIPLRKQFKTIAAEFGALEVFLTEKIIREHQDFSTLAQKLFDQHDEALKMRAEAQKHMALVKEYSKKADLAMDSVEAMTGKEMDAAMDQADRASTTARRAIIGVTAVGFAFGIFLGLFLSASISRPLSRVIKGLSEGSNQVASASGEVSGASQSLAEGASQQAASIEETSSSMEELSSMTKKNAENSHQADTLMRESGQVVKSANEAMRQLIISMEDISKASDETSKIVKTIDEIAFQTNLLALNAAVEAARAGEAGAGFAVVADEVRTLAMRAADAAKTTSSLIQDTLTKVNDGSQLVSRTNEAFAKVEESAEKVSGLVAEISLASGEQSDGIEQINNAIAEMDKVVQQNAANAEESAAASEELNAQAEQLLEYVNDLVALVDGHSNRDGKFLPEPKIKHPLQISMSPRKKIPS